MQAHRAPIIQGTLASEARLQWLTERLGAAGSVTIAEASTALGVSEMTIRRDLAELEHQGAARRVRGGARAAGPQTFAARRDTAGRAKTRIAAKLRRFVPSSGVVAFDASSTIMRIASELDAARDLSIVTNGTDSFAALQGVPGVTALMTGGQLDTRTGSLVGPLACRSASQLRVQTFFASAAATDPGLGTLEETLDEAEVKRSIAAASAQVILAVDGSKLEARASAVGLSWDQVGVLVTDLDPADERLAAYRDLTQVV
jgi:DeoR family fructose operon transcriptional repressor